MKKHSKEINLNEIRRCDEEESSSEYAPDPNQDYGVF